MYFFVIVTFFTMVLTHMYVTQWLPEVTHFCENVPKLLVGTKLDFRQNQDEIRRLGLVGQRLITEEEVKIKRTMDLDALLIHFLCCRVNNWQGKLEPSILNAVQCKISMWMK